MWEHSVSINTAEATSSDGVDKTTEQTPTESFSTQRSKPKGFCVPHGVVKPPLSPSRLTYTLSLNIYQYGYPEYIFRPPSVIQHSVSSETLSHHEYAPAGVAETPSQYTSTTTTTPTSWELDGHLTFDSIVGNPDAKRALFEHVVLPLKLSEAARTTLFGAGILSLPSASKY